MLVSQSQSKIVFEMVVIILAQVYGTSLFPFLPRQQPKTTTDEWLVRFVETLCGAKITAQSFVLVLP